MLAWADGSAESLKTRTNAAGIFAFSNVAPGLYIAATGDAVQVIRAGKMDVDAGALKPSAVPRKAQSEPQIVTVCEALERRAALAYQSCVIVGIFKSGMDETLRLDCPMQLMSGDLGWPSSIGLTRPIQAPDQFRARVEKKRQEVIKSSPPEAPLRPERVVGLYGIFVPLQGLSAAPCCRAPVETVHPPARLFGMGEIDLSVIR